MGLLMLSAVALAALAACGGGGDDDATAASDTSVNADHVVNYTSDDQKVVALGSKGFVAQSLGQAMPAGTTSDFQILVVGDADNIDEATKAQIKQALESGKQVVLDGPSDGSNRILHTELLRELTGMRIECAAVRIQKAPNGKGYYVTPIDRAASASADRVATQNVDQELESSNDVASIFGLAGSAK